MGHLGHRGWGSLVGGSGVEALSTPVGLGPATSRLLAAGEVCYPVGVAADDSSFEERAAARRARLGIVRTSLGEVVAELPTTPEERLAMMGTLSRDAWLLAGRTLPTYGRSEMPGRVLRRSTAA